MEPKFTDSDRVGFKLMDFADMETILDIVLDDNPEATADLKGGGYWELDGPGEVVVDLEKVSAALERPFDAKDFLVWVSSYYGRVSAEDTKVTLRSEMMTLSDYEAEASVSRLA